MPVDTCHPLNATHPLHNATLSASAGTGKTWMLTTRIIRLLLAGAPPSSIVAITFTRKAAGEMRERVMARLEEFARANAEQCVSLLAQIGETASADTVEKAGTLHHRLLNDLAGIQFTTFHAFCQDILRRFPMEADVPAGFELLEHSGLALDIAWERLSHHALSNPDSADAQALLYLFEQLGTLYTTQKVLYTFVEQRSDWWAYTGQQEDNRRTEWAIAMLAEYFDPQEEPYQLIDTLDAQLERFTQQLKRRKAATKITHRLSLLSHAQRPEHTRAARYQLLVPVFITSVALA